MARETLPLLAHLPRLEADGVTHRRDCECVRCDAGFRPTEHDRTVARERWQLAKAQQAASRALDRRREKVRAKKFALVMELDGGGEGDRRAYQRAARRPDARRQRRRAWRCSSACAAKVFRWPRRCRVTVDRVGPAGIEPATRGLKVPCSTS